MKRYSRKVREEAALICAVAASGSIVGQTYMVVNSYLGFALESEQLARQAWIKAVGRGRWTRQTDAEAEALIRTGWSPS